MISIHMNETNKSCGIKVCSGDIICIKDVVRWKRCIFSKVGKMYAFDEKFGLPSVPLKIEAQKIPPFLDDSKGTK